MLTGDIRLKGRLYPAVLADGWIDWPGGDFWCAGMAAEKHFINQDRRRFPQSL